MSGTKVRGSSQRRRWTEEEKEAVRRGFSGFVLGKKLPGKRQTEKVQKMEEVLAVRTWTNIKDHLRFYVR